MPAVVTNVGCIWIWEMLLYFLDSGFAQWDIGLYTNNYDPVATTLITDLTEPVGSWYSRKNMNLAGHDTPTLNGDGKVWVTWSPTTWTSSSGSNESIYGWFVGLHTGGLLIAQKDPYGPRDMGAPGSTYSLQVTLSDVTDPAGP